MYDFFSAGNDLKQSHTLESVIGFSLAAFCLPFVFHCLANLKCFDTCSTMTLKPGLHISRKDRKHMVGNVYFKMYGYGLLSLSLE